MTLWTVPGTGFAQLLVNAGDGPTMIINRDETLQLYVGDDNSVASKNGTGDIDIIDPLSYIVYDGIDTKYGICATPGQSIQVDCVKGATNWQPSPQQAAQQIALLGLATATNQVTQNSTAQATNNVLGTGIALPLNASKETGGNLATHTSLLSGASAGALIANPGLTVAQEAAALLATGSATGTAGGVPLLHGFKNLTSASITVPAASSSSVTISTIANPGYQFSVWASYQTAAGATPFGAVQFVWKDPGTANNLGKIKWQVPVTNPGGFLPSYGNGPIRANSVSITFTNFDAAQPVTFFYEFAQTTHHIARDDWRGEVPVNVPGFTSIPGADPFSLILGGGLNINLPGNVTTTWLMPLYAGAVWTTIEGAIATGIQFVIEAVDQATGNTEVLFNVNPVPTNYVSGLAYLPRMPCRVLAANGNAGAETINFSIMAQEYAS